MRITLLGLRRPAPCLRCRPLALCQEGEGRASRDHRRGGQEPRGKASRGGL